MAGRRCNDQRSRRVGHPPTDPRTETGSRIIDPEHIVRNLTEQSIGASVVHIEHGVGRYLGLQTPPIDDENQEFPTLSYAEAPNSTCQSPLHDQPLRGQRRRTRAAALSGFRSAGKSQAQSRGEGRRGSGTAGHLRTPGNAHFCPLHSARTTTRNSLGSFLPGHRRPGRSHRCDHRRHDDGTSYGPPGMRRRRFGKTEVAMRAAFVAVQEASRLPCWSPPRCSPSSTSTRFATALPMAGEHRQRFPVAITAELEDIASRTRPARSTF